MAKKKSRQQEAIDAGQTLQQNITDAGQQYQNTIQQAGQAYQQGLDNIANNYQNSANDAMSSVQRANEAAERDFTDIAQDIKNQYDEAQRENAIRSRADLNSAKYAGVTELASSIANLIGVGALGASNQTYQNYSQNWMQRADQERRARQARMDNIRERERQQRAQIAQLRQGGANALAQMRLGQAGTVAGLRGNALQAGYQSGRDAAQAGYQAGTAAAQAGYQGTLQGLQMGMHEDQMRQSAAQHEASLKMQAAAHGLKSDGKGGYVADPNSPVHRSRSGSGGRGDVFYFSHNGRQIPYSMTDKERKAFLEKAYAKVKDKPGFKDEYGGGAEDKLRDEDANGVILKYAEQDPELRDELYNYTSPEYRQSRDLSNQVNSFFSTPNGTTNQLSRTAAIFPTSRETGWGVKRPDEQ